MVAQLVKSQAAICSQRSKVLGGRIAPLKCHHFQVGNNEKQSLLLTMRSVKLSSIQLMNSINRPTFLEWIK